MSRIEFPNRLAKLLSGSDLQAPIRLLADRVGEILADNKLPFFPDYTDHGTDHINRVLKSEVELVPTHIWDQSKKDSSPRLLKDVDAAVIIGATLLHDIAMYLRPAGFAELIAEGSRFQPLVWFKDSHEGNSADRTWKELWDDYARQARRFSDRELTNIIGEKSARIWKFDRLPEGQGPWEHNHFLIVGEFIRRHHARLAHEVAIYGFPGVPVGPGEGQFPGMGKEEGHPLSRLADLIGLTARSHGMSLRVCKSYLDSGALYQGTPRPMDTAILFPMALLRVSDYLQIDRQRAPAVLLQLRDPQSPISVIEWKKHLAVQSITTATDPRGKMVTVSTGVTLPIYLQLRDLLDGLQREMDHSTAVLDEAYGTLTELGLNQLSLATRRVYSNLDKPAFTDSLPYVPKRTGFAADPNLLTLLVEPLYGDHPGVGVRELMQNAVDAVRELGAWCTAHGKSQHSLHLPKLDCDVLIEFVEQQNGRWLLRVQDRGIGMTSDTLQNYFLRAGASFRKSAEWEKEYVDEEGHSRVARAGRFGIGAFAVFLLGPSFRLKTRHVNSPGSAGYEIAASANSQLIEITRKDGLPVGTTIEVDLTVETAMRLVGDAADEGMDWYCWEWPKVRLQTVCAGDVYVSKQEFTFPIPNAEIPPEWSVIYPKGFDAVYWTFSERPGLTCNGIKIAEAADVTGYVATNYGWSRLEIQLAQPNISVVDNSANFPVSIRRDRVSHAPSFIEELARDATCSVLAYALVCGPTSRDEAISPGYGHPLLLPNPIELRRVRRFNIFSESKLRWCSTTAEMIVADPWLIGALRVKACIICGELMAYGFSSTDWELIIENIKDPAFAFSIWSGKGVLWESHDRDLFFKALTGLVCKGVPALGQDLMGSRVLWSMRQDDAHQFASEHWRRLERPKFGRQWFQAENGTVTTGEALKSMRRMLDKVLQGNGGGEPPKLQMPYIGILETKPAERPPESMIAKVWNECLGLRAIPFDPTARAALIAEGRKHPQLKRHIDAWQKMKASGSDWTKVVDGRIRR